MKVKCRQYCYAVLIFYVHEEVVYPSKLYTLYGISIRVVID